jgi:hypothetical protein
MSTWTERIELFFSPLTSVTKDKVTSKKPNAFVRFFQKMQAHRLAQAERMINDRMKYWPNK